MRRSIRKPVRWGWHDDQHHGFFGMGDALAVALLDAKGLARKILLVPIQEGVWVADS